MRESLEFFGDMDVAGNIDADKALKAISCVEKKITKK